ncbi:MAG: hypothetical protein ACI4AL_04715 [Aristaeellaceae bacterium]
MRKSLQLLCLICVLALIVAAARIFPRLPADSQPYVEKKYAGWNGVLRGWISSEWSCGGSFVRWLNACAAGFEKRHEGVYLEFTEVDAAAVANLTDSGIRPPELVLFSPGVQVDAARLLPLDAQAAVNCGSDRALPVAIGGYIWVYNRALCDGAPTIDDLDALTLLPDVCGRSFSAAAVALLSGESDGGEEIALPDPGLDLGLPAMAQSGVELNQSESALTAFINGELPYLIVTQAELARLIRLRDAGRGPDWACAATGEVSCADQLLLLGVVGQSDESGAQREALAAEFAAYLLSEDCQKKLADIGGFAVTDVQLYSSYSAYAPMEALLRSRALAVPDAFSEHSRGDAAPIVREFLRGNIDAKVALMKLGLEIEGYESPT